MTSKRTNWSTYAYAIWTILVGFIGAPLAVAGVAIAWAAATGIGRAIGLACVLVAIALQPIAWRRRLVGAAFAVAAVGCLAYLAALRFPSGGARSSTVEIVGPRPSAYSPTAIVPELDQLFVASHVLTWFSGEDADSMAALRDDLRAVYREYAIDFDSVPSLLDDALTDECSGRSFVWPPAAPSSGPEDQHPPRSLVFVHGYGGSWSGYLRVLRPVANAFDATLVQPSCGVGRWTRDDDLAAFDRYFVDPGSTDAADREVHVVALSNAGLALSRRLGTVLERAKSVVLISPAFDLAALAVATPATRSIPVLVIAGDADDRVPMEHVRAGVERLRRLHLDVRLRVLPGADHFAFLHERAVIRSELEAFFREVDRPRPERESR